MITSKVTPGGRQQIALAAGPTHVLFIQLLLNVWKSVIWHLR